MAKISMWSSFFCEDDPETMLAKLAACGYRHVELSVEHTQIILKRPGGTAKKAAAIARCAADHGIAILQAHLSMVDPVAADESIRTAAIETLKPEVELFAALGVKAAVLHASVNAAQKAAWPQERIDQVRAASLQTLCAVAAGSGLLLALENLLSDLRNAPELLHAVEHSGCAEGLGICLDTGHLNLVGGDPAQFRREAGPALIALHLADNRGQNDDHIFPFGGYIRWGAFLETFRTSPYPGLFNFEVPGERIFEPAFPEKDAILLHKARFGYRLGQLMFGAD